MRRRTGILQHTSLPLLRPWSPKGSDGIWLITGFCASDVNRLIPIIMPSIIANIKPCGEGMRAGEWRVCLRIVACACKYIHIYEGQNTRVKRTPKKAACIELLKPVRAASTPPVTAPLMMLFHGSSLPRMAVNVQSNVENRPPHTANEPGRRERRNDEQSRNSHACIHASHTHTHTLTLSRSYIQTSCIRSRARTWSSVSAFGDRPPCKQKILCGIREKITLGYDLHLHHTYIHIYT